MKSVVHSTVLEINYGNTSLRSVEGPLLLVIVKFQVEERAMNSDDWVLSCPVPAGSCSWSSHIIFFLGVLPVE